MRPHNAWLEGGTGAMHCDNFDCNSPMFHFSVSCKLGVAVRSSVINQNSKLHSRPTIPLHLIFEMGAITLDKVIFISMILESLVYGSRPKSSCSVTDKLGVRNIYRYVWLHFVGPHSRKKRSNKHEVAVAHTGTLYASYSGEPSYRIYASNNPSVTSSIWPPTHIDVWRHSSHTEIHPALLLISAIYRVQAASSKVRFMLYKLCWVTSVW